MIVLVIIGILSSIAVPKYARHISTARSAEAPVMMGAMIQYASGFYQAHDDNWPQNFDWTEDFDSNAVYFVYIYNPEEMTLTAQGVGNDPRINEEDSLTYDLENSEWSSEGNMYEIQPVNVDRSSI